MFNEFKQVLDSNIAQQWDSIREAEADVETRYQQIIDRQDLGMRETSIIADEQKRILEAKIAELEAYVMKVVYEQGEIASRLTEQQMTREIVSPKPVENDQLELLNSKIVSTMFQIESILEK